MLKHHVIAFIASLVSYSFSNFSPSVRDSLAFIYIVKQFSRDKINQKNVNKEDMRCLYTEFSILCNMNNRI
jgi:hypothetical protein